MNSYLWCAVALRAVAAHLGVFSLDLGLLLLRERLFLFHA